MHRADDHQLPPSARREAGGPASWRTALVTLAGLAALASAAAGLTGCGDALGPTATPDPGGGAAAGAGDGTVTVVRVVDGDTLHVELAGREETVRLIGIDTPESKKPDTPVECFAPEAASRLGELAPPGTRLRLERDEEVRDRYGRLLAYAWRADDDTFVNATLAAEGYAATLTIAPNTAHAGDLAAAERSARDAGRGLWGSCGGPHVAR